MVASEIKELRIDKWLWFVRFYKTRGLAAKAVRGGHVRINGRRARPSSNVKAGDVVDIVRDQLSWRLSVVSIPARRGPAAEARSAYVEDVDIKADRERSVLERKLDRLQMPRTDGKPDKHTRRKLRARRRPPPGK